MEHIDVIFSAEEIAARIKRLAQEISQAKLEKLLVVSVLKGSFVFTADLIRALHVEGQESEVDFLFLSSYGTATTSSGEVTILHDVKADVRGRNVLIVDDILETGRTLAFAQDLFMRRLAKSVNICVLLDKPVKRAKQVVVAFKGFDCPDLFVIGYGMDYAHKYRELPFIGALRE